MTTSPSTIKDGEVKYDPRIAANILGSGAFGTVYKATYKGEAVALKKITFDEKNILNRKLIEHGEIDFFEYVTKHCDCKYITRYLGSYNSPDSLFIVMEYCKDEFKNIFEDRDAVISVFPKCVQALHELHKHKIVHRDIKPENILYDLATHTPKITDFGAACKRGSYKCNKCVGTRKFTDPYALRGGRTQTSCRIKYFYSDMYSLGVTFYNMFYGGTHVGAHIPTDPTMIQTYFDKHYATAVTRIDADIAATRNTNHITFLQILKNLMNPFEPRRRFTAAQIINTYYPQSTLLKSLSVVMSTPSFKTPVRLHKSLSDRALKDARLKITKQAHVRMAASATTAATAASAATATKAAKVTKAARLKKNKSLPSNMKLNLRETTASKPESPALDIEDDIQGEYELNEEATVDEVVESLIDTYQFQQSPLAIVSKQKLKKAVLAYIAKHK